MKENIYVNKKSDKKFEMITKDIDFEPGVYTLFALEKNLFVIKKKYYNLNSSFSEKETKLHSSSKEESRIERPSEEESIQKGVKQEEKKNEESQAKTEKEEDKNSTQEWYKKALELKVELNKNQFMILMDLEDVRKISYVIRQEINSGEVLGIRGFDKNYYIFKKGLFDKLKEKLLTTIKSEPITYDDILEKTKLQKEQLNGMLEILKEQSDLIEVRKGLFKKV